MLAKRYQLYKNVLNMSGEHQSTVTGNKIAKVTFSPEASGYQVVGVPAQESLAKAAQTAMMLELAAARVRVLELESERDGLLAARPGDAVEFEADLTLGGEAEVYARVDSAPDAFAPEPAATEPEAPAVSSPDELETSPPPAPPEGVADEDKLEAKPSRKELRRISRINQSEILREIITHNDFDPSGRLEADNISGLIKKLVQARTGMSDSQWDNTYTVLKQKKLIKLSAYEGNLKKSYAVTIDMERLAEFIEKEKDKLFEQEEDEVFKKYFAELRDKPANPADPVDAPPPSAPVAPPRAAPRPPIAHPAPPAAAPSSPPPATESKPAAAGLPLSGTMRRHLAHQAKEAAALRQSRPGTQRSARGRSPTDELVGPVEVIVPKYAEVTEEEWEAITEDDVRFLLALSSDHVRAVDSTTSDKLLLAIVEAGRINANDDSGVYDPKIMSSIIKELRLPPQPKIVFSQPDGKVKLELTKAGEEYLAIQFRKVRLAVTRAREATPKASKVA